MKIQRSDDLPTRSDEFYEGETHHEHLLKWVKRIGSGLPFFARNALIHRGFLPALEEKLGATVAIELDGQNEARQLQIRRYLDKLDYACREDVVDFIASRAYTTLGNIEDRLRQSKVGSPDSKMHSVAQEFHSALVMSLGSGFPDTIGEQSQRLRPDPSQYLSQEDIDEDVGE